MAANGKSSVRHALNGYIIGFVLSLGCTFVAYWVVWTHVHSGHLAFPHGVVIALLGILAVSQFVVQAVYFLHLGTEAKPRWRVATFWFMIVIVLIIVVGSIWIMNNLNYNMMSDPGASQDYINRSQGF